MSYHRTFAAVVIAIVTAIGVSLVTQTVSAAPIAYDGFGGYTESPADDLIGQTAGGSGFTGNWIWNGPGTGGFSNVVSGGLTYSNLLVSGDQHVEQSNVNGYTRGTLSSPIATGTVYMSVLARAPSSASTTGTWGPMVTPNRENINAADVALPHDDTVHFIVWKFELGNAGKGDDLVTTWFDAAPGTSEAANVSAIQGTAQDTGLQTDADWSGILTSFVGRGGWDLHFDEIRLGTTWADVTPAAVSTVPEPASYLLIGIGLCGLLCLRRRHR